MYLVNLTKQPLTLPNLQPFALKPQDKEFVMDMLKELGPITRTEESISTRAEMIAERLSKAMSTPMLFKFVGIDIYRHDDKDYQKFALSITKATVLIEPPLYMAYDIKHHCNEYGIKVIFPNIVFENNSN